MRAAPSSVRLCCVLQSSSACPAGLRARRGDGVANEHHVSALLESSPDLFVRPRSRTAPRRGIGRVRMCSLGA